MLFVAQQNAIECCVVAVVVVASLRCDLRLLHVSAQFSFGKTRRKTRDLSVSQSVGGLVDFVAKERENLELCDFVLYGLSVRKAKAPATRHKHTTNTD